MSKTIFSKFNKVVQRLYNIWMSNEDSDMETIEATMHKLIESNKYGYFDRDAFYEIMNCEASNDFSIFSKLCEEYIDFGQSRIYGYNQTATELLTERNPNLHSNL